MKARQLQTTGERTWVLVLDPGEEVIAALRTFVDQQELDAAWFTAIGGFENAILGFFERDRRDYRRLPYHEQVEVLTLNGTVSRDDGGRRVHSHAVLGRADGAAVGGHLLSGRVYPTLEVVLEESPSHLVRHMDSRTGIPLLDLGESG